MINNIETLIKNKKNNIVINNRFDIIQYLEISKLKFEFINDFTILCDHLMVQSMQSNQPRPQLIKLLSDAPDIMNNKQLEWFDENNREYIKKRTILNRGLYKIIHGCYE